VQLWTCPEKDGENKRWLKVKWHRFTWKLDIFTQLINAQLVIERNLSKYYVLGILRFQAAFLKCPALTEIGHFAPDIAMKRSQDTLQFLRIFGPPSLFPFHLNG
jgi:hypothetical protein